jgi:hypothetical protein
MFQPQIVAVTTAAQSLRITGECIVKNVGDGIIYFGNTGVSAANGYPLAAGETLHFAGATDVSIVGSAAATLAILYGVR